MPLSTGEPALVCRVATRLCALPLAAVAETMRPLPIAPLPARTPVLGAALIRGGPVPVVDVAAAIGAGSSVPTRFVTVRLNERLVALAVGDVLGVRTLAPGTLQRLPPLLHADDQAVSAIGSLDHELLVVLETARLLSQDVWEALSGLPQ